MPGGVGDPSGSLRSCFACQLRVWPCISAEPAAAAKICLFAPCAPFEETALCYVVLRRPSCAVRCSLQNPPPVPYMVRPPNPHPMPCMMLHQNPLSRALRGSPSTLSSLALHHAQAQRQTTPTWHPRAPRASCWGAASWRWTAWRPRAPAPACCRRASRWPCRPAPTAPSASAACAPSSPRLDVGFILRPWPASHPMSNVCRAVSRRPHAAYPSVVMLTLDAELVLNSPLTSTRCVARAHQQWCGREVSPNLPWAQRGQRPLGQRWQRDAARARVNAGCIDQPGSRRR